jgi:hypothetical protein
MSNNRPPVLSPAEKPTPTTTASVKTDNPDSPSTSRLLAREGLRIGIVGGGVAAALYIPDLIMHTLHTQNGNTPSGTTPPQTPTSSPRPGISGLPLGMAKTLLRGYASAAQASMLKNAALTQRSKLLNPEKTALEKTGEKTAGGEDRVDIRAEEFEEGSNGTSLPLSRIAGVSTAIGLVDTTLTQYPANQRTWHFQHLLAQKNKTNYTLPQPSTASEFFKAYSTGYLLRLTRNVMLVGGLISSSLLEEKLKKLGHLTPTQSTIMAATLSGALVGAGSNALDILYKNQVIALNPQFKAPSAFNIAKRLTQEQGYKALTRGYGTSILYTILAYNTVPYMEEFAKRVTPSIERKFDAGLAYLGRFFKPQKSTTSQNPTPAPQADATTQAKMSKK